MISFHVKGCTGRSATFGRCLMEWCWTPTPPRPCSFTCTLEIMTPKSLSCGGGSVFPAGCRQERCAVSTAALRMSGDLSVLRQPPCCDKSSSFVLPFLGSGGVLGLSLRSFSFLSAVFGFPGRESAVDLAGGRLQMKTGSEKKYPTPL